MPSFFDISSGLGGGPAQFRAALMADSPLALWDMQDASGNPQDSSGNGNHCTSTTVGTAINYKQPGPFGIDFGIQFNNSSAARSSVISSATDNFTMCAFVRVIAFPGSSNILIHNGNEASSGPGIRMKATGAGAFVALAGGVAEETQQSLSPYTWSLVTVIRRSTVWEYYINATQARSNAGTDAPPTPSGTVQISQASGLNATLAYVCYFSTAVSSARVAAWWTATGLTVG